MFFNTKSNKQIELSRNGKIYTASADGKVLGTVSAAANGALGWHLSTGAIAITVADKDQKAVKEFLASWVLDVPMSAKVAELKDYFDDHAKILKAMGGN